MRNRIYTYLPGIIILCLCIVLGLSTYKDYGVSWDEPVQRDMGLISYRYVTENDHKLDKFIDRDHGTGFELVLIFIEQTFHLEDARDIYQMRHIVSHLFFFLSCFFGYILCYRLFRNNVIACIGFLMFVFQPRIFSHSFHNTKDVPFLAAFLIALMVCQLAFDKDKPYLYMLAGIAAGYASSIRILGIMLACIMISLLLIDLGRAIYKKEQTKKKVFSLLLFIVGYCLMLFVSFPSLWAHPVQSFVEVFQSLSHFKWGSNLLFDGQVVNALNLPRTYIPIWFCNTLPVVWLAVGVIGMVWVVVDAVRKPLVFLTNTRERNFLIYLGCFLLPVLSIIILKSVVYDDWRHVYFIYPSFVLLAMYALNKLYAHKKVRIAILGVMGLQFAGVGYFMVKYHPHQQVYFNELVPHKAEFHRFNYDMDYWGVSFKQGIEYVLKNDPRPHIKLSAKVNAVLLENNAKLIPPDERQRLQISGDVNDADYVFTNFRYDPKDLAYSNIFYEIKVQNSTILRVYKVR